MMYLYAAYTIIWAGIFVYILKLHMAQKKLKRDMRMLKEVLDGRRDGRKNKLAGTHSKD